MNILSNYVDYLGSFIHFSATNISTAIGKDLGYYQEGKTNSITEGMCSVCLEDSRRRKTYANQRGHKANQRWKQKNEMFGSLEGAVARRVKLPALTKGFAGRDGGQRACGSPGETLRARRRRWGGLLFADHHVDAILQLILVLLQEELNIREKHIHTMKMPKQCNCLNVHVTRHEKKNLSIHL